MRIYGFTTNLPLAPPQLHSWGTYLILAIGVYARESGASQVLQLLLICASSYR